MLLKEKYKITERPKFPKKVVITSGMPYGNKGLHMGHIGGLFVHADIFSRFMRDRIGTENVIFVSGTDGYGSPIIESYRKVVESDEFEGTVDDFVKFNHDNQKKVLADYQIDLNLYAASNFGRASEIHNDISEYFFNSLYKNRYIEKMTGMQFFDTKRNEFLNGRQVEGKCPISGCSSETGYADECALGHQYDPTELIDPVSCLSGGKPELRTVVNWYFKLPLFRDELSALVEELEKKPYSRKFALSSMKEFFLPPTIYVKKEYLAEIESFKDQIPEYRIIEGKGKSLSLVFKTLKEREAACAVFTEKSIRYRNGKTLVPFRLTGNVKWGVKAPDTEDQKDLTFWVWPESLWAPISFTSAYIEEQGKDKKEWKKWWTDKDTGIFQFIGEDNIYFYGIAEMAMFMAMQGKSYSINPEDGTLQLPDIIDNNHLLFLDKKASSSGKIKPPMAAELLNYYTSDQLRAHFFSLGLGIRSVGFKPKPLNPDADERTGDPVMKEGNLLCNVFNRSVRSCFYAIQKFYDGKLPVIEVSKEMVELAENAVLNFERRMYKHEFHQTMAAADMYLRSISKYWDKNIKLANSEDNDSLRRQIVVDTFYTVRIAAVLMHSVAPKGTEMIREYFNMGKEFWNWDNIFNSVYSFMEDPETHKFKFLEPRVDFFEKHISQIPKHYK